jgi:hypothetical protein
MGVVQAKKSAVETALVSQESGRRELQAINGQSSSPM